MTVIRIGTRSSELAMWQANFVRDSLLAADAGLTVELVQITTSGDKIIDRPLPEISGKGLFTKEIEDALLAGDVDLAVHSLKDLPTQTPSGLSLAAVMLREDPAEALISRDGKTLDRLPPDPKIMTGSPRRAAQVLQMRPDAKVLPIRGNVPTRIRKFRQSDADAMILACAGLIRLGLVGEISQRLDPAIFLPACGQGALALEIRAGDSPMAKLCRILDDPTTRMCVTAEREFLAGMGGGCQSPVGAYGRFDAPGQLTLTGMAVCPDSGRPVTKTIVAKVADAETAGKLGRQLSQAIFA